MTRQPAMVVLGVLVLLGAGRGAPAETAARPPRAIAGLEPGLWELKSVGDSAPPLRLCVGDPRLLLQPIHAAPLCHQFTVEDEAEHVTVSYDCGRRGQGHTALRVETPRLVQIDSQGVAEGRPFAGRFEGRRIAACSPGQAAQPSLHLGETAKR